MARLQMHQVYRYAHSNRALPRTTLPSAYAQQRRLYAGSNYGGGEGDPKGENPQDQGPNPSAGLEHPGPPPPAEGQGTGGGPTKKGSEGHNTDQSPSSSGQGASRGGDAPQPRILQHNAPEEHSQSDEVKAHNKDMAMRHDRPNEKSPDKEDDSVNKGFWSGKFLVSA